MKDTIQLWGYPRAPAAADQDELGRVANADALAKTTGDDRPPFLGVPSREQSLWKKNLGEFYGSWMVYGGYNYS